MDQNFYKNMFAALGYLLTARGRVEVYGMGAGNSIIYKGYIFTPVGVIYFDTGLFQSTHIISARNIIKKWNFSKFKPCRLTLDQLLKIWSCYGLDADREFEGFILDYLSFQYYEDSQDDIDMLSMKFSRYLPQSLAFQILDFDEASKHNLAVIENKKVEVPDHDRLA